MLLLLRRCFMLLRRLQLRLVTKGGSLPALFARLGVNLCLGLSEGLLLLLLELLSDSFCLMPD